MSHDDETPVDPAAMRPRGAHAAASADLPDAPATEPADEAEPQTAVLDTVDTIDAESAPRTAVLDTVEDGEVLAATAVLDTTATDPVNKLLVTATAWLAQDPDPETRAELRLLIQQAQDRDPAAVADLHSRFDERLAFGTAGLRGAIAAGSNRMNRVLVSQAAAGLAAFLLTAAAERRPGSIPSVVIGYDGRRNSHVFATDTAAIMAGAGVRAVLLPRLLPTPVLAFAVRHLGASAGVMVTASHNPPNDNGYKVYLGDADAGSQIVSPDDVTIAAEIQKVADTQLVTELPRAAYETAPESVVQAYVDATAAVAPAPRAQVKTVYTALHGVGWDTTRRVLDAAGFALPTLVDAQIAPDSAFPTVAFPNPEEPGAMDLAYETAREVNAELIIANDPDADRLAIAIPDTDAPEGYRRLSGNEIGAVLGWRAAELAANAPGDGGADGTLACSIVSTPALKAVADAYGMRFADTLTGFKWVSRANGLVYGFEEALGYLVNPGTVRDKDGISAAVALLSLVSELKAEGLTLADHLDAFAERFGFFASSQISVRVTDLTEIDLVMARLRQSPPAMIGSSTVDHIDDLSGGFNGLPPSDVLRIVLADGSRVMVRPSGTEPKLKVYLDTHSTTGTLAERREAASAALAELDRGMRALIG
ncbi:phospho-sugar mutase [Cryobacterium sp. 1639]|uniref:phospho-sugar mutase n=1 Tax=Cryobacterium inferilacus TaxID=2866629 RepID=UPI0027E24082|nr:phospho-sugar mutase [Cryobacterium sp. 1639]